MRLVKECRRRPMSKSTNGNFFFNLRRLLLRFLFHIFQYFSCGKFSEHKDEG